VTCKGGVVQLSVPHTCRVRDPSSQPSQVEVLTTTLLSNVGNEEGMMAGIAVILSFLGV